MWVIRSPPILGLAEFLVDFFYVVHLSETNGGFRVDVKDTDVTLDKLLSLTEPWGLILVNIEYLLPLYGFRVIPWVTQTPSSLSMASG